MAATTVTVAGTPAPGLTPALADTSRSGSAMRMRAESRGHGRPAGATKATIASLSAAASRPACEPNTGSGGKWAREWD